MNQYRIKIFMAIVREGSISGAARALHFAQPTVSEALSQLEKELEVRLVRRERGAHQVQLTPAGKAFLPVAQRWLEADEQLEYYKQSQKKPVFRLAASFAGHEYVVGYVVQKLRRRDPELDIRLLHVESKEMDAAIERGDIDAAFSYRKFSDYRVETKELYLEERYVVCPSDTNLPDRILTPADLDPRFEVIHQTLGRNGSLNTWRDKAFPGHTGPGTAVVNIMAIPAYLTEPNSWALLPASVARSKVAGSEGRLVYRRLEPPPPSRGLRALIMKAYPETRVIRDFLECCSEYIDERPYLTRSPKFPPFQKTV